MKKIPTKTCPKCNGFHTIYPICDLCGGMGIIMDLDKEAIQRQKLIHTLRKIANDLEQGYGGFLYLYDEFVEKGLILENDN